MNQVIPQILKAGTNDIDPMALAAYLSTIGAGAVAGTGNTVQESVWPVNKSVITVANTVTITDQGGGHVGYGSVKVYDFPAGAILVLGATANLTLTAGAGGLADAFDGDFSIGTAAQTASDTISNGVIIPSTATTQAVAGVGVAKGQSRSAITAITDSTGGTASDTIANTAGAAPDTAEFENAAATFAAKINALIANQGGARLLLGDGTTTAIDAFLNIITDDADTSANDTLAVAGTITLYWVNLGDY
jgi:hypothetical protein